MPQYLTKGATSLAAASWSGSGFGANAELVIEDGSQKFTDDLDQSGAGTIDYLHIGPGFSGRVSDVVQVDFDNSYTTQENLIWRGKGDFRIAGQSSAITAALCAGGGSFAFEGGDVSTLGIASGAVTVNGSTTLGDVNQSGGNTFISSHSSDTIANLNVYVGTCRCERPATNVVVGPGATVYYDSTTAPNTLTIEPGGRFVTLKAGYATGNIRGTLDASGLQREATLGSTASNIWPTGRVLTNDNGTLSNESFPVGKPIETSRLV